MANKPTPRQLSYLRSLAERTGQTFTYPHTFAEASREIDRLKRRGPSSHGELEDRARDRRRSRSGRAGRRPRTGGRDLRPRQLGHLGAQPPPRACAHVGPAGAQAHHPGRRQAHRAGPLHRRRGRAGRVRPARGWRRPRDRPPRDAGRPLPTWSSAACRPRTSSTPSCATTSPRPSATGAPPLASCPVDRYLDAVA